MVGREYFVETLPLLVAGHGGFAIVRIHTKSGSGYVVRDIIKTHEGSITFNAWVDSTGDEPIVCSSSSMYEFDVRMPSGINIMTLPFEDILDVQIVPASATTPILFH